MRALIILCVCLTRKWGERKLEALIDSRLKLLAFMIAMNEHFTASSMQILLLFSHKFFMLSWVSFMRGESAPKKLMFYRFDGQLLIKVSGLFEPQSWESLKRNLPRMICKKPVLLIWKALTTEGSQYKACEWPQCLPRTVEPERRHPETGFCLPLLIHF